MANKIIDNKYVNKVKIGTETYMDLTDADALVTGDLLSGKKGYSNTGALITGTCDYDYNTSQAVTGKTAATAAGMLTGTYAFVNATEVDGTMPNKGEAAITVNATSTSSTVLTLDYGYYANGSTCTITGITDSMIAEGTTLFGIQGAHSGSMPTEVGSGTPTLSSQTISPSSGHVFSSFTIAATPITTDATGSGVTVTVCPNG